MVLEHKLERLATRGALTLILAALLGAVTWLLMHDPEAEAAAADATDTAPVEPAQDDG